MELEKEKYDADYFLRGKETGKSLYTDYRWMPDLTIPMAEAIAIHTGIKEGDKVLDFGCARGYLIRAFLELGYLAYGYDISKWALINCDKMAVNRTSFIWKDVAERGPFDLVIAKDVLEHVEFNLLNDVIKDISLITGKIFVVVPLSPSHGKPYTVPEYEQDITHVIRMPLWDWHRLFVDVLGFGWNVDSSYRKNGVKDNYYSTYPDGNGFLTITKKKVDA